MRSIRRAVAWWACAGTLAGCAGPGPWAPAPTVPTLASLAAPTWHAPLPHRGQTSALVDWWTHFDDPLLPRLVDAAQAAHPSLASATARVAQARAASTASQAALLPRADAQALASRARTSPEAPIVRSLSAGASWSWEMDLFGAVTAGRDAASARLRAAQANWHDARVLVAAEVAQQYLSLRACEAQWALAEADARSRAETDRLTRILEQAGLQSPANAALARASAAQGRSLAVARRANCDGLVKVLVEWTTWDESMLRSALVAGAAKVPKAPALPLAGVPAQWLAQRPDVGRAAEEVQAAAAALAQSKAQRMPQLSITGTLGRSQLSTGPGPATQTGNVWSFGPVQLALPLFDGGRLAAGQESAQAAYQESESLLKARVRTAVREVEEALVALDAAARRADDMGIAAEGFREALRGTETRHRGGLASLFELEDARRNAVAAESAWFDWQREQAAAWIALYRALGGGWTANADTP